MDLRKGIAGESMLPCGETARAGMHPILAVILIAAAIILIGTAGDCPGAGNDDFDALIRKLASSDGAERASAARELGMLRDAKAVPHLCGRLVEEKDPRVAVEIARALGCISDKRSLPYLIDFIARSGDAPARRESSLALVAVDAKTAGKMLVIRIGTEKKGLARLRLLEGIAATQDKATPKLMCRLALSDESILVRKEAVRFLAAHAADPEIERWFAAAAGTGSAESRIRAAWACGRLGLKGSVPVLAKALQSCAGAAAIETVLALGRMPDSAGAAAALGLWHRQDKDAAVRAAAAHAMGGMGDPRIAGALAAGLGDSDPIVRFASSHSLAAGKTKEGAAAILAVLKAGSGAVDPGTAAAAGRFDDPALFEALSSRFASSSGQARAACLASAAAMNAPGRADLLRRASSSADAAERGRCARLIGYAGLTPLADVLDRLSGDASLDVRMEAVKAMGWLACPGFLRTLLGIASSAECHPVLFASCVEACGKIVENGSPAPRPPDVEDALGLMMSGLSRKDSASRAAAIWGLENFRDIRAVDALIASAAGEEGPFLRKASFIALARLTGEERGEDLSSWKVWRASTGGRFPTGAASKAGAVSRPAFAAHLDDLRRKGIDLAFVFDVTGSMGSELETAQARVSDMLSLLAGLSPSLRAAFIAYRDEVALNMPFTFDHAKAAAEIAPLQAFGGDPDWEEGVETALDAAVFGLDWREHARKIIVLVGDAPPHQQDRAAVSALLARERLGITVFCATAHTDDPADLPSFARIAVAGGGGAEPLAGAGRMERLLVEFALGPEWAGEAGMIAGVK